jgi:hypothetical protein
MRRINMNKYYYPKARNYLTPDEKWKIFQGFMAGFISGLIIVIGILLIG